MSEAEIRAIVEKTVEAFRWALNTPHGWYIIENVSWRIIQHKMAERGGLTVNTYRV